MISQNFTFKSQEGTEIFVYTWMPDKMTNARGIVQIAHGMAETGARYERFAEKLTDHGYIVYIHDHRGHGKTAKTVENLGILAESEGFKWLVEDLYQLSEIIKQNHPELPLFLFGHSMGSFVTQRYIMLYGRRLKGVIISGSNGRQGILLSLGICLAKAESKKHGRKARSEKLTNLTLGSYNKSFKPNRTKFDWLSRDTAEVDKFIQDPFCGTTFTAGFFEDLLTGLKEIEHKPNLALVPKELPVYIVSGEKDPVGKNGRGILKLFNTYKKLGLHDVTYRLYKDGRHEMLNETNREEVMNDIILWLDEHCR
ncbi:lysophospholipase [Desulfosporosinus acidiphilus SJ4]|uniref:Lysophospholipase n=1 Tax=Desulfosporosinus acidiphilus (strain DSM 22704 / JCM 16185 / SJ4) TaxID=646529 RepID=I4D2K3_DESAJ|nr:alpha/beta hydrolase [Desulfosporosinus acidiphilus]AFM40027.1 lysophospholipase [Desulfosporosinus acidiphilus SJ4]